MAYLALLGSLAVAAAWYSMRAAPRLEPPAPAVEKAIDETSWLADLYSQNPRDIATGTAKVNKLGARALPQIQATLRDPNAEHNHRRAALRAAAILGVEAEPVIPEVTSALHEPDLTADASVALSFMGPKALPPLEKAIEDDDPAVRREALRSIGKLRFRASIDSETVLPLLVDAMNDEDETVRGVAATYLGIIHEDPASSVPVLIQGLQDPNPDVRRSSATALGAFGGAAEAAMPQLRKAAGDKDPDLAREAGRALAVIAGR